MERPFSALIRGEMSSGDGPMVVLCHPDEECLRTLSRPLQEELMLVVYYDLVSKAPFLQESNHLCSSHCLADLLLLTGLSEKEAQRSDNHRAFTAHTKVVISSTAQRPQLPQNLRSQRRPKGPETPKTLK